MMKALIIAEDDMETKCLAHASDMATVLFHIVHNLPREFRDSEHDHSEVWNRIKDLLDDNGVIIDELTR